MLSSSAGERGREIEESSCFFSDGTNRGEAGFAEPEGEPSSKIEAGMELSEGADMSAGIIGAVLPSDEDTGESIKLEGEANG